MKQRSPWIMSFGRVSSRDVTEHQKGLMQTLLPKIEVDVEALKEQGVRLLEGPSPSSLHANGERAIVLEIGYGGGEHLAHRAKLEPEKLFIGCEVYAKGIASMLTHIEDEMLANVRLWQKDARYLVQALPEGCLERVYILFPDPWPKLRHHKRRIVNQETLSLLARAMKPGAELLLATDWADYAQWMKAEVQAHPAFAWVAQADVWKEPEGWTQTRYQRKALDEGRQAQFIRCVRR